MKRLLPNRTDLAIFAAMAVLCAGIVMMMPVLDLSLSLLSIPIFITAAMLGMYRCGHLSDRGKDADSSAPVQERL